MIRQNEDVLLLGLQTLDVPIQFELRRGEILEDEQTKTHVGAVQRVVQLLKILKLAFKRYINEEIFNLLSLIFSFLSFKNCKCICLQVPPVVHPLISQL